ncbi:MAG TPA: TIGR02270 family protein [Albitalea sp.]
MQLVYATGCVSAVGLNALQTCAAVRARQSGIEAVVPQAGEPLLAAAVPARAPLKKAPTAWLKRLALRALRECLSAYAGDPSRLALFIALPEPHRDHAITHDGTGHAFVSRLVRSLGLRLSAHSRVLLEGHASAAVAMQAAAVLLERNEIDAALIGGVDSLLNDTDRERLHHSGRLHEPGNPFGLIPGEAAAFLLTGRAQGPFSQPAIACLAGAASAQEDNPVRSDRYSVGIGLQQAIGAALQGARADESRIEWRVTDINGERYRAWESTALLARQYRAWRDGLPCLHLPAFTGDVGCASLPLQAVVAAHAMQQGYAPGPLAVCESSSEGVLRGACLVAPVAGARPPPFRVVAKAALDDAGAVVARQLQRLPHEVAWLAQQRHRLVRGHGTLARLEEFDERIEAHLALLRTLGARAWHALEADIAEAGDGALFAPAVLAIESGDPARLKTLFAAAAGSPPARGCDRSLLCAFGWVSGRALQGLVAKMTNAPLPLARWLAAATMHLHRTPPGPLMHTLLDDTDPEVRLRSLRLAGEVGVAAALERVRRDLAHADEEVRFAAAVSATLLGDRGRAIESLTAIANGVSPLAHEALLLLARTLDPPATRRLLQQIATAADAARQRSLIEACGASGDPHFVPWLIHRMHDPRLARIAGDAFTSITGQPLAAGGLDGASPRRQPAGTNDDPDDTLVELDADDGLPWPDAPKVAAWWQANGSRLPAGVRLFFGRPATAQQCHVVLRCGSQRQRRAAAQLLALLQPASGVFNTSAPAWRQRDLLTSS